MRKKETLNKSWLQRTFRIKKEVLDLYKYLEYFSVKNDISKDMLFDIIINYSLIIFEKSYTNNFKLIFDNDNKRVVKGFTISNDTLEKLENTFFNFKRDLKKGEFIEILIYIYAKDFIPEDEFNKFDLRGSV